MRGIRVLHLARHARSAGLPAAIAERRRETYQLDRLKLAWCKLRSALLLKLPSFSLHR